MCGISGIIHKNAHEGALAPVGLELINMLDSLKHRGLDSCGVTVCGEEPEADFIVRVWIDSDKPAEDFAITAEELIQGIGGTVNSSTLTGEYLRLTVNHRGEIGELAKALLTNMNIHLHSIGKVSEVVKDVGSAMDMEHKHKVSALKGTHGIGHVRMATESRVDINHSHPFWAYPFPDVTVVHNGQLTNYHKLTRKYEDKGYLFQTENDSELIAVYLADKLHKGLSLESALRHAVDDLDGTFTFLASTEDGLGYAKDRWSAKPLVTMETSDVVAIASEEVALRSVFNEEIDRVEPQESEVKTWLI